MGDGRCSVRAGDGGSIRKGVVEIGWESCGSGMSLKKLQGSRWPGNNGRDFDSVRYWGGEFRG